MPQIQWAVHSYVARALPLSAQRIVNFYAEQAPKDAKSPVVLFGAPGTKSFADLVGDGPIRGMEVMDGLLYAVSGCVLYSVDSKGRAIARGSMCNAASASSSVTLGQGATNESSAEFSVTAGSDGDDNKITSIAIDGEEILPAGVNFTTDNATTAALIVSTINGGSWDVSTATYNSVKFDYPIGTVTSRSGITFKPDGTRFYATHEGGGDEIFQFDLSTAFDISTAVYNSKKLDVSIQDTIPNDVAFNTDGTKMFMVGESSDKVHQFTLSTAWDISTGTADGVDLDVSGEDTAPTGIAFSSDGTKMFILGFTNDSVFQYTLTTGFDLSTATYDSLSLSVNSEDSLPTALHFRPDGKRLFVIGVANDTVFQYSLTTAWNITTATYDLKSKDTSSEDTQSHGLAFSDDGTRMFVSGAIGTDAVYQYDLGDNVSGFIVTSVGSTVIIEEDTKGGNGLSVVITTTGDVQVDPDTTTMEGGFEMPAIVETTGGGGIPLSSPGCVSMSHNQASPSQLAIVDGTNGWIYDTTNGLRQITDEDFFSADVVDFQDQYFIFNRAGTGQFFLSNLNDGTAYLATDIAIAEGDPDNLVALISNRRELWLFGAETIEVWYNSGDVDFPFNRFEGGTIERGLAAAFSIAEDDNSLFWLGEDRIFYRADGYLPQRISQHGIEEALRKYKIVSDACAFIYTMGGHKFYVCTFPAEDATWVYDITTSLWHERQSVGMGRWRVNAYANAYGKHLVGDFEQGRIGELDLDTFEEWGEVMQGQATGPSVYADRQRTFHRRFELDIDAGHGLTSGQGSDPQVWLDYSDDGGHTWSARKPFFSIGKIGAYLQRLRWLRLGQARQRIYRLTVSAPVKRSIVAAHLDAAAGDH